MPSPAFVPLVLAAGIVLLVSCSADSPAAAVGPTAPEAGTETDAAADNRPEPGIAKGRVTDSAGHPMAGVQVRASHTMFYNSHLYATTGADGRYRIELSGIQPSSWRVGAAIEREFEGARYMQELHVDSHAGFPGAEGAVRNLQWRLGGEDGNGGWHGATASILQAGDGRVDGRQLVLLLDPVQLIDGQRGQPLRLRVDGDTVRGIPIGRHRVSVRHEPPGGAPRTFPVRDADRGSDAFAPAIEVSVRQDRSGYPVLPVEIEVPADAEWVD